MNDVAWASGLNAVGKLARACAVLLTLMLAPVMVAGCSSLGLNHAKRIEITASFDPQQAAFIHKTGKADIRGQAFVRQSTGKLWRATGTDIELIPSTPYADERMAALYGDTKVLQYGVKIPDPDPVYVSYMRTTIASSSGYFTFEDVADGEYYIIAMIHLPSDYHQHEFPIMERVKVENGKSVRVVMRGY